jgi:hypothetical protein
MKPVKNFYSKKTQHEKERTRKGNGERKRRMTKGSLRRNAQNDRRKEIIRTKL